MAIRAALLLVEDDRGVAQVHARLLTKRGFDVTEAHSLSEAVATTGSFDVAVLDIDLGDGTGVDCARRLLARSSVKRCIFFTGGASQAALAAAADIGPVVSKGSVDALLELLARFAKA